MQQCRGAHSRRTSHLRSHSCRRRRSTGRRRSPCCQRDLRTVRIAAFVTAATETSCVASLDPVVQNSLAEAEQQLLQKLALRSSQLPRPYCTLVVQKSGSPCRGGCGGDAAQHSSCTPKPNATQGPGLRTRACGIQDRTAGLAPDDVMVADAHICGARTACAATVTGGASRACTDTIR